MQKGEVYIVSTGMGNLGQLTPNALDVLKSVDLVVGYKKYIEELAEIIEVKDSFSNAMTQEVDRCKLAVKEALIPKKVAVVSNGDANVFGMAGLVLEIINENDLWDKLEVSVEPGISTMFATAAKAGAPIMNDFAVVSLSNRLTPLEQIEIRLRLALEADFVLGIYNPLSKTRKEPFHKFIETLSITRKDDTPIVIAKNVGRDIEDINITTVGELLRVENYDDVIDMSTFLLVGNSQTKIAKSGKHIITPRGYEKNYDYNL